VGSPDEHLTVRETVLLVIDAAGGHVEGRTAVQKLCYFAGLALGENLGHGPYFYGPYSKPVETALENEAFAGDLDVTVKPYAGRGGREHRTYIFDLTEQGREVAAELREASPRSAAQVDRVVGRLGELVPGYRQHPLSVAAKVDLILSQQREPITAARVPELARGLGWEVDEDEVTKAVEILVGLERVAPTGASA
jgi:hypothetical protein